MSTPTSVRKRVSQACQTCASKKIKCDGRNDGPDGRCGPCAVRNEPECIYGVSKRRRTQQYNSKVGVRPTHGDAALGAPKPIPQIANGKFHDEDRSQTRPVYELSPDVSKRLFQAYFESIHPMWPLLYKPLYTSLDYTYPSPSIPEALILAIFSIGSCVDGVRYPKTKNEPGSQQDDYCPEPKEFFEASFNLLQKGSENIPRSAVNILAPTITTCQVLVILALQQHGVAEYPRAAILCGLASAMAIELHLHRVYEPNEPVEREIRSRLWWSLYILEKMLSGEQGRPFILRADESDCPWPSTSESDEFELMTIPSKEDFGQTRASMSVKLRTISALHTTISLSIIIEDVYRFIYGLAARKSIRENPVSGDRIRLDLWGRLIQWERDLPPPLTLDLEHLNSVPGAITNIVIMLTEVIMCHRPFILRWTPGREEENPFTICLAAANRMCNILEKYLERSTWWPCDMVFSIFVAASIFLHHSKQVGRGEGKETRTRLKLCIHWLSVLGRSWQTAGARTQLLNDLYDLPQELQDSATDVSAIQHTTATVKPVLYSGAIGHMTPLRSSPQLAPMSAMEDWAFLRDFGDSTDQFYDWDTELRNLLNSNLPNDLAEYSFG